jgi:predicted DNA-binding mobile mystery protein A
MKISKNTKTKQRQVIEKKILPWIPLRDQEIPPSGWIKAIRGSLGITTHQLADFVGVNFSTILRLEEREAKGKATIETIQKVANGMGCKLVYAIVPQAPFENLEEIIESRAKKLAQEMIGKVSHSMKLEKQGADKADESKQIERLTNELKAKMDSRIWNRTNKKSQK